MIGVRSVLVAGATGFIGSALVRRLADDGVTVYGLVRAQGRDGSRLQTAPSVEWIAVPSFEVPELRSALAGLSTDLVINLAAYGVHQEDRDPEALLDGNVHLVTRLLVATAGWPLKGFIHTGSCSEYGTQPSGTLLREDHPVRPTSLYGAAKAASVMYGNALAVRLGTPFVTLRLFGVFGVGERPDRLVPYLIDRLLRDEPADLTVGAQVRDFTYVDDVVEAFLAAGRASGVARYTTYNVCSGRPVRVREIGEAVATAMGKPRTLLQWGRRPYRTDEPTWLVGDHHRFTTATGWQPRISLDDGIRRMIGAARGVLASPGGTSARVERAGRN